MAQWRQQWQAAHQRGISASSSQWRRQRRRSKQAANNKSVGENKAAWLA